MVGGMETITMELAQRLARETETAAQESIRVTVATPRPQAAANESHLPFAVVRKPSPLQLLKLIATADILHLAGTDMLPLLFGWLLRRRMVVEHHGFQTVCPNGQMFFEPARLPCPGHYMAGKHLHCLRCNASGGVILSLKRWLLTSPRRWLCSRAGANVMPTAWLGGILQLPRMVTIHHGLSAGKTLATQRSQGTPTILFLGRLVSTKGVHVLLKAVQQLRNLDFRLEIIGDGPERPHLEAEVGSRQLERHVSFRGYLPADDVEQAVAGAKAVVMPSLGGEVFGLVALENMLRKKVLIVSELGSLTEVVGDAGLVFPAGDAHALADCLRRVLQSDELAEQTAEKAVRRAGSLFTTERMIENHLLLYRRLMGAFPGDQLGT